jgi:hypothetical protein
VGIHGRKLNLTSDLFIMGYSERGNLEANRKDFDDDTIDEMENIEIISGISTDCISEMLLKTDENIKSHLSGSFQASSGIFLLNYHYAHTLNQFLFHLNDELENAAISTCIITSTSSEDQTRLPAKFGKLSIVSPKGLRNGFYSILELEKDLNNLWCITVLEEFNLNDHI